MKTVSKSRSLFALSLTLSAAVATAQVPTGRQQIGCGSQPIALRATGPAAALVLSPNPSGFGNMSGFFLFGFAGSGVPGIASQMAFPMACCGPNPATVYQSSTFVVSPSESLVVPVPASVLGSGLLVWVQELIWRPPTAGPCQTYVTNQVEFLL